NNKLLEMLNPKGDIAALPQGFLARLKEISTLYSANSTHKRKLHRQGTIALEQMEEVVHYDKWQWRLAYQLGRFGDRHKDQKDTIDELQRAIVREQGSLISILHVLARWATLLTREE